MEQSNHKFGRKGVGGEVLKVEVFSKIFSFTYNYQETSPELFRIQIRSISHTYQPGQVLSMFTHFNCYLAPSIVTFDIKF